MTNRQAACSVLSMLLAATAVMAQNKPLYRWVDEDGVIHLSDERPQGVTAELIPMPLGPPTQSFPDPSPRDQPTPVPLIKEPSARAGVAPPSRRVERDLADMSLDELDLRCEIARDVRLAPLREAEIARCKSEHRGSDPAWCERRFEDFGQGGRTVSGAYRPRTFGDLPECVDALKERQRRRID